MIDANQAMAMLDVVHHYSVTRINRKDGVPGVSVTITDNHCRVTAQRRMFVDAVAAAFQKLADRKASKSGFKLVG